MLTPNVIEIPDPRRLRVARERAQAQQRQTPEGWASHAGDDGAVPVTNAPSATGITDARGGSGR